MENRCSLKTEVSSNFSNQNLFFLLKSFRTLQKSNDYDYEFLEQFIMNCFQNINKITDQFDLKISFMNHNFKGYSLIELLIH